MNLTRHAHSFCTTCYKEIPAVVCVKPDGVWMTKRCADHGETISMVERDPLFYQFVSGLNSPSIYNGYFLDVTRVCNLRCKFCYYALEKQDPVGEYSIDNLLNECRVNVRRAPFILTGGEATTRTDIVELIRRVSEIGPAELITNGVKLADSNLFQDVSGLLSRNNASIIHLSIHPETDKWREVIARARASQIQLGSLLIVIDSEGSFVKAVEMAMEFKDVALAVRIKAASQIWNEQKPESSAGEKKIFVSDMLKWLEDYGYHYQIIPQVHNKSVFLNVNVNGVWLMLVSWHDTANVDLEDIDCAPYYRARNGSINNMVTSMLLNEGMSRGWLAGRPYKQ